MCDVAHQRASEWLSIAAAMLDAQHVSELERIALSALNLALPRHQAMLLWAGYGQPDHSPTELIRPLGQTDPVGWLIIRPVEVTETEAETLNAIERLIIAGYERLQSRTKQAYWQQRLNVELDTLSNSGDPELVCHQLGRLLHQLIGGPVEIGVVVPFASGPWLELITRYRAGIADATAAPDTLFWLTDVDLSSVVIRLGVPISSTAYLTDCTRYNARPHPNYQTPETAPTYWFGTPIRLTGETIGMAYALTAVLIDGEQQRALEETVYRAGQLLRPVLVQRKATYERQRSAAWQEIVAASAYGTDPDRAMQRMLEASCRLLEAQLGGVFLWDEDRNEAVFRYVVPSNLHQLIGLRLPLAQSILTQSVVAGQSVIVNNATDDPRRSHVIDHVVGITLTNLICVPHTTPTGMRIIVQFGNRRRNAPFTEHDVEQIQAVAGLMGLVLDNGQRLASVDAAVVQQTRELERRNADLRSVLAFNREILSVVDQRQLFQLIVDAMRQRFQFQSAALFVNQREHSLHPVLTCVAVTGELAREFWIGRMLAAARLDVLVNEWAFGEDCFLINRRSPAFAVLFNVPSPSEYRLTFGSTQWETGDLLVVLLRATNREAQAVLLLDQPINGKRPEIADLEALTVYASIAGAIIDMALLRDRQQRSLERLTALNGLGMVIHSQSLPQTQVLEMTARGMLEMVNASWAHILLHDRERDELVLTRALGLSPLEPEVVVTLARRALLNRKPVFRSATTVAVPLRGTQRMIGVIALGGDQAFESADVEMLMLYATQAAVAVESMRLLAEVQRGRDNLARVMAAVQDGLILFTAEGAVMVANEAFYRLAQTTLWSPPLSQIEGRTINEVLTQWAMQRALDSDGINQLLRSLTVSGATGSLTGKDGTLDWIVTQAGDLATGRSPAFLLTIRDVTAARDAERLRNDLTDMLVHDLRNPLSTILLAFERLVNELGDLLTERQQQAVRIGQNSACRLLDLVNAMLEVRRLESGQMPLDRGPLPIETLIERVIDPFSIQAQHKQVKIEYRLDPQVKMVFADRNIIGRVLQNLLDNALKFSPPGGVITLEVQSVPADGQDQVIFLSEELAIRIPGDRIAHIVVRDQGPGIPPEDQETIFDRFSQAGRKRSEGSGLGLTFCRLAVEAHHGSIRVESALDQGSAFHVTLPLAEIQ